VNRDGGFLDALHAAAEGYQPQVLGLEDLAHRRGVVHLSYVHVLRAEARNLMRLQSRQPADVLLGFVHAPIREAAHDAGRHLDVDKHLHFDTLVTAADVLGDRLACRIDNAHVPAAQRIDCTDPVARESRPRVINP
jgi:hypothetical protein